MDDWRASVIRTLKELVGADRGFFELRAPGVFSRYTLDYEPDAARSYVAYYSGLDLGRVRRNGHKLAVWSRALMFWKDLPALYRSEGYNDFLLPNGMTDSMGLTAWKDGRDPARPFFHKQRFGFTKKQATVALLLAQGKSNSEIAQTLFISPHTARHHTESVLLKLGINSRAAVGPMLLATS